MNLDMTLREFFEIADRMAAAAKTIRDAQAMLGGRIDTSPTNLQLADVAAAEGHHGIAATLRVAHQPAGVLRSTPQPSSAVVDPPEGLMARGKTGVEIIAERQREEIQRRAEARGEVVVLDPKLGLMDAEAQAVKARLKQQREAAEAEALAKMTPEQRAEYES